MCGRAEPQRRFQLHVQEPVINAVADIPVLGTLFGGSAFGIGIFTAGLILSIMILPFISAVTRDVPPRARVIGNPARVIGEV